METREDLQRRLSILRKNLAALEEQKAQMGLEVPLRILNEIDHAKQQIFELEERLEHGEFDTTGRFLGLRPPRIYHNLPQPDYGEFVGREKELADVMQRLRPYPHSVYHHITIDGIGGIGKSALALEVAHRYLRGAANLPEEERFDAIIWTSAKQSVLTAEGIVPRKQTLRTLDDIYTTISITLQREDITRARPGEQAELVRNTLTQQRTLLIVDNLETVDDKTVIFLRELPAPTKVIVTTRHRIDIAYPIRLVGMLREDAQTLITQECEKKGVTLTDEEADKLHRRTGGVPLAIVWSVAQVGIGYGVETVLARLGQPTGDIARYCFEGVVESIRGTDAHKLLMALALFATDASREALGSVAGFGGNVMSRDEALVKLEKLSLVNKQGNRFSMLPLTKLYSQREWQLSKESKDFIDEATGRWETHLIELVSRPAQQYWIQDQEVVLEEGENFLSLLEWAISQDREDTVLKVIRPAVLYLQYAGRRAEASKLALIGKELAQRRGDRSAEAWLSIDVGWILSQQGAHDEALKQMEEGLKVYKELSDATGVCFAQCFLAQAMRHAGRLTEAEKVLREVVQRASELDYSEGLSIAQFELGKLARDRDDWQQAYIQFDAARKALSKLDKAFLDIFSLAVQGNYGAAALKLGKHLEAKQVSLQTLAVLEQRRDLGLATNFTARMYLQVAEAEKSLGNYTEAVRYTEQALTLLQSLKQEKSINQARTLLRELEHGLRPTLTRPEN